MYNDPPEHVQEFLNNITELFDICQEHADAVRFHTIYVAYHVIENHLKNINFNNAPPPPTFWKQKMKTIKELETLYNILLIQDINGLKLPEWSRKIYPEPLLTAATRNYAILTETDFMKRIKGGKYRQWTFKIR